MKLVVFKFFCEELKTLWSQIDDSSQRHVFQTYEWLEYWQQSIGKDVLAIKPWIAVILDEHNQPKMICPFGVRNQLGARVLEFLGNAQSDYQGPLISDCWISDLAKIKLAWKQICDAMPGHDIRHFHKLPAQWCVLDNPMLKIWKSSFQDNSYSTSLPDSFNEFQMRQRKKFRQDTKRQHRRLSEKGTVKFEVIPCDYKQWRYAIDRMIEQKSLRCRVMKVPDIFSEAAVQDFYRELPHKLLGKGTIHFSVLKMGDEILASHWGAVYQKRFYYLVPTIIEGELGVYSPGRLLLANLVEWCIQNGVKVFDFTIGGEDYKRDWCDNEMPLFEHLHLVTPFGIPYLFYIRLRRWARRDQRIWGGIKFLYSHFKY